MGLHQAYVRMLIEGCPEASTAVAIPNKQRQMTRRVVFSFLCLLIFLTLSSIPVYGGMDTRDPRDPLHLHRLLLSANRGSLLELGLSPLITADMFLQVLEAAGLMAIDQSSRRDRTFMRKARKVSALLLSIVEAMMLVAVGKISVDTCFL